jgi:serine/threonine protein kinase
MGLVLYELLTGHPPFQAEGQTELLHEQAYKKHVPLNEKNAAVSKSCEEIIDKMLEKSKEKRYQSWKEVKNAVERYFERLSDFKQKKDAPAGKRERKKQTFPRISKPAAKTTANVHHADAGGKSTWPLVFLIVNILLAAFLLYVLINHS